MPSSPQPSSAQQSAGATQAPDQVLARMTWLTTTSTPDVELSFMSTAAPEILLAELRGLGWVIPRFPTPPSEAIEWIPDPVTGADHTVHPWRVEDFRLGKGQWTKDQIPAIGSLTFETLRRNGAQIGGTTKMLETLAAQSPQLAPSATAPANTAGPSPTGSSTVSAADAVGVPRIVLVNYRGEPVGGLRHMEGVTGGRSKTLVMWSESTHEMQAVCSDEEARVALLTSCDQAWILEQAPPAINSTGSSTVCAVVPGVTVEDKKLKKFAAALGDSIVLAPMRSFDQRGSGETGVLVYGGVAANAYELLASNLRVRFKSAVIRIDDI